MTILKRKTLDRKLYAKKRNKIKQKKWTMDLFYWWNVCPIHAIQFYIRLEMELQEKH